MPKKTNPHPPDLRGLATNRINKEQRRTVERLPNPLSAHGDALVTVVGENLGDHASWGSAFRFVLVIPPAFPGSTHTKSFTVDDCLSWLAGFSHSLVGLEERDTPKPYRMVAALEGSPNRGRFYTIILEIPKAAAIQFERFKKIVISSKPKHCLLHVASCHGFIEVTHLMGRLGLVSPIEGHVI
jgi:hypothetical protein